ncbi:MAG: tetratricopeptide repeat protein, partial [Bacteroidales bacterium]|nr:tetratricopeptide repeat protein [Bacteroidales bacterium]
ISMIDSQMANTKKSQKGLSLMLLLLCLSSQSLFATDYVDSLWNQATRQYTEGQYQEAVQSYLSIVELGLSSADLHYNLGNAYFKSQQYGFSILHYEKALKLAPSHKDARFNLQLANEHVVDDIEQVPEFILTTFVKKIGFLCNSDVWAVLFLVFLSLTLLSLLFLFLSRSLVLRKTGFACAIVAVLLAAASLSFSLVQKRNYTVQDSAIVVRSVVEVKSSPTDDDSSALFILHEGTKVKLLDTVGPWKNVELSDGRQGWMKDADLEII